MDSDQRDGAQKLFLAWGGVSCALLHEHQSRAVMTIIAQVYKWESRLRIQRTAVLVALVCLLANVNGVGAIVTDEGWALLDFKSSIVDSRGVLSAWRAEDPYPCEWYGISCDKNFHISGINLHRSGLSGTISPELRRLRKLRILSLSENNFSGPIPPRLSEIGGLWKLKLDHNSFSGSIPGELGHLSNLKIFDLSYNDLSGLIPETIFQTCRRLWYISFAQNRLEGSLPNSLRKCTKITGFDFSTNSLQGNIEVDFSKLKDLNYIDLQRNRLTGHIPAALGNLTSLNYLNMGNNMLSGQLPQELKQLDSLKQLSLNNNLLSGEVPENIVSLPSLQHLDLSYNAFSGRIRLSGCRSLQGLNLAQNMFEGDIPHALGNCTQLVFLNIAHNRLNGTLPPDIGLLAGLNSLDASGNHLVGEIPANISRMTAMSALVLRNNGIHGKIPPEVGNLKALQILDLSYMNLDGGIPSALESCTALQKLDLSCNKLSGSIPADLGKLLDLRELGLENNMLTGDIPPALGNLTLLSIFNVSHNHLSGRIPRENSLAGFGIWSFHGNSDLCGAPWTTPCKEVGLPASLPSPPPTRAPLTTPNVDMKLKRRPYLTRTAIFAIAITATIALGVLVISLLSVVIWRKKKRLDLGIHEEKLMDGLSSQTPGAGNLIIFNSVHSSTYSDCVRKGISTLLDDKRIIGRGSIGTVYKATRSDGITIAVKKLNSLKRMSDSEEFEADMRSMENLRHKNLVELHGYYLSTTLKLILSEFIPNGTLSFHLHYRNPTATVMTWTQRFNIGLGIARGLDHLHSKHCPPIMHFNLTSANVILDDRFEAKISDYGLRKFLPIQNKYISSRLYYETLAYVAPELACGSLRVSEKCDVYSFGVVLLELVTGQKPSEDVHGATVLVGDYVKSKLEQQRIWECIDPRLFAYNGHQVGSTIKLALRCTSQEPSSRPTMAEAVWILESLEGASSASEHVTQID